MPPEKEWVWVVGEDGVGGGGERRAELRCLPSSLSRKGCTLCKDGGSWPHLDMECSAERAVLRPPPTPRSLLLYLTHFRSLCVDVGMEFLNRSAPHVKGPYLTMLLVWLLQLASRGLAAHSDCWGTGWDHIVSNRCGSLLLR